MQIFKDLIPSLPLEISSIILLDAIQSNITDKAFLDWRRVSKAWKATLKFAGIWREMLIHDKMISSEVASNCQDPFGMFMELLGQKHDLWLIGSCIQASTSDHISQTILSTISPDPFRFWSSQSSAELDRDEWLDYFLLDDNCFISAIEITPFLAQYQRGLPCYAPLSVSFSIGKLQGTDYFYSSSRFAIANTATRQLFTLPFVIRGGRVRVHLHGHASTQPGDMLYYTALEQVTILGLWFEPLAGFTKVKECLSILYPSTSVDISSESYRIVRRWEGDKETMKRVNQLLDREEWDVAIREISECRVTSLVRRKPFLELLKLKINQFQSFEYYFRYYANSLINQQGHLNQDEAIMLAELAVEDGDSHLVHVALESDLIDSTLALGQLFEDAQDDALLQTAHNIYCNGRVFDKILQTSMKVSNYRMV